MLKSSVHLLSFLHIPPRPPLASVTYFLLHTLKISSLQAPADVHLMPLCLHYEYARFKLLFSWSHVGLKVGCLGSFPMRKMHFVPPDKAPSRREMVFSYPGICEAALPAFRASLPPSFFLREENTYVVCTYGAFPPPPPPLGPLSVASCFTPVTAPSTHAALDLWGREGKHPSCGHTRREK